MLNILIDTNVALDFVLHRQPFYQIAEKIVETAKLQNISLNVSAASVTDIYYLVRRELRDRNLALQLLKNFLNVAKIAAVSENEINKALDLDWNDFEDAVQYSTALLNQMDYIVTRNAKDFKASEVPAISPEDFCALFEPEDSEEEQ